MAGGLWRPEEVRKIRRANRWTLATTCTFLLAGAALTALGASLAGNVLLVLGLLAFTVGTLVAVSSTSAGRGTL